MSSRMHDRVGPDRSMTVREERVRLQRLLLPDVLPSIGCTEAGAAYRADNDELRLGGDWFDLIDRPESQTVVAIVGDVVGHGVEQISAMGQLRAASNALSHAIIGPSEILAGLDRFADGLPFARHATVAVVVFDGTPTARICCAGHPPPIRVDASGGVHVIETGRRAPLTLRSENSDGTFPIETGDVVVLYSDGVVERRKGNIDTAINELGDFVSSRSKLSCVEIAKDIVDIFGADAEDDQAVLVLRPVHSRLEMDRAGRKMSSSPVSW